MAAYIILLIYISFLGYKMFFNEGATRKKNRLFLFLAFTPIFLLQSLRGEFVGWDTKNYVAAYRFLIKGSELMWAKWETGFTTIYQLTALFSDNPQWMLAGCAAVIMTGYGIFIYENTEEDSSVFWPVFFFFTLTHFFSSMNLLRQSCAMAFSLNIYTVLKKDTSFKGYVKAVLLLIAGFMFHSAAIVCIGFFLPFVKRRCGRFSMFGVVLLSVAGYVFFPKILEILFQMFPKYQFYEDSEFFSEASIGAYYLIQMMLKAGLLLLVLLIDPQDDRSRDVYRLALLVALSIGIIMLKSKVNLAGRLSYFYDIFTILLIPKAINRLCEGETRQRMYGLVYLLGVFMLFYTMLGSSRGCVPYTFFWQA